MASIVTWQPELDWTCVYCDLGAADRKTKYSCYICADWDFCAECFFETHEKFLTPSARKEMAEGGKTRIPRRRLKSTTMTILNGDADEDDAAKSHSPQIENGLDVNGDVNGNTVKPASGVESSPITPRTPSSVPMTPRSPTKVPNWASPSSKPNASSKTTSATPEVDADGEAAQKRRASLIKQYECLSTASNDH